MRAGCFTLLLLASACSAGGPATVGGNSSATEYQPLEIGWRWVFQVEGGGTCTRTVVGRQNVGRFDCRVVEETSGDDCVRWWLRSDRDGLKLYRCSDEDGGRQDLDDPAIWFKYPAVRGQRWEYDASYGAVDLQCTGLYEADERVKVPAGEFACARVRTLQFCDGQLILEKVEWYAKGIGLVRQSMSYTDGREARHTEMSLKEIAR